MIKQGDCLEVLKSCPDRLYDLIILDPPYNIGKADWDNIENYIEWMSQVLKLSERILKETGSMYLFHNEMPTISRLMVWIEENTKFKFKQFIVWNKKFRGAKTEGYLQGFIDVNNLRNYQKMAEYILYYTFQDDTGLTEIMLNTSNFATLRKYFYDLLCFIGETNIDISEKLGHRKAEHCFYGSTQWDLPTKETYQELIDIFKIDSWIGYKPWEELRQEYEELRYTFNNKKTHHSIWNYEMSNRLNHMTPKPVELVKNILRHSTNENNLVLDPFLGSGTTAVACKQLNRVYTGIEINPEYVELAQKRIKFTPRSLIGMFQNAV